MAVRGLSGPSGRGSGPSGSPPEERVRYSNHCEDVIDDEKVAISHVAAVWL